MSTGQHPLSDAKRVARIKALVHDIDVVVCMYPFAFMFQELAKVIGMVKHRELAMGWYGWKAELAESRRMRRNATQLMKRLRNKEAWDTLMTWNGIAVAAADRNRKLRKAAAPKPK